MNSFPLLLRYRYGPSVTWLPYRLSDRLHGASPPGDTLRIGSEFTESSH